MARTNYRRMSRAEAEQIASRLALDFLLTIADDPSCPWTILSCHMEKSPTIRKVGRHWRICAKNSPPDAIIDGGETLLVIDLETKAVSFRFP